MHMASPFRLLVSPTSGVPIYRQIMDQVRHQAAAGRLTPGEFLPSIRQAAAELQVNPMTVSKAYSLLERDGVVENVRGKGVRVADGRGAADGGPSGGRGNGVRERQTQLRPLIEQVAAAAYQLALTPDQVRAVLDPLLEELDRHDPATRR